mmetsp:Transcript_17483/g.25698  ORF Transcript_17483/g.25698 Transcript_17483/m.25698 type:complete len:82 (-) Transcript_17483:1657-1902(-)
MELNWNMTARGVFSFTDEHNKEYVFLYYSIGIRHNGYGSLKTGKCEIASEALAPLSTAIPATQQIIFLLRTFHAPFLGWIG